MKTDYFVRKENRINRLKELADKNEQLSITSYNKAKEIGSFIPMGQPILVGHHSERRHRGDLAKIDNAMRKSCEADDKSKYYAHRADAAENNTAISSDNPNAVRELEEKLAGMEAAQEKMKAVNKIISNRKLADIEKLDAIKALNITERDAVQLLAGDFMGRKGFPSYSLTNNNANIKRVKDRIEKLKALEQMKEQELTHGDVQILFSPEKNRVQIFFPGKPSDEVRAELKREAFKWAPSEGAWQRHISKWAYDQAVRIVKKYY